jgi:hypothetical protein
MNQKTIGNKKFNIDKKSIKRALNVALIVGVVLNLINNPQIFSFPLPKKIPYFKVILTFMVPFLVSLYSSIRANMDHSPKDTGDKTGYVP